LEIILKSSNPKNLNSDNIPTAGQSPERVDKRLTFDKDEWELIPTKKKRNKL